MYAAPAATTIDATGEYVAFIGNIAIDGQATSKTLDTTGSSSITFAVGVNPVFDDATSVFTVGLQGVDNTTGFPVRPDGTWAARSVVTTAVNTTPTLTTSSDYHVAIPTLGSSTLSHGDQVCIVLEMTTSGVAATSSLGVNYSSGILNATNVNPAGVTNISGSVANILASSPSILITFSDGTLGWIDGSRFAPTAVTGTALTWTDGSATDEYGLIFQVPWACSIDALGLPIRLVDGTSDFNFDLNSAAESSPASLISGPITKDAQNFALAASLGGGIYPITPVNLAANTDYCISMKATGAGNIRIERYNIPVATARPLITPAGTTVRGVTRAGGSGAFGSSQNLLLPPFAVRISDIASSGGSGMLYRAQGTIS